MKVAIIFIGTAKYLEFLPAFYDNSERYLFPNVEKQYYVFTDGDLKGAPDNVTPIYQENWGFPKINLMTYEIMENSWDKISECTHLLFLDADALPVTEISFDELFGSGKPLFCVHHPCHYLKMAPNDKFPGSFDTNPESTACVKEGESFDIYWQSCVWGGTIDECEKLVTTLAENNRIDDKNGVMALWHDESQINRYFLDNPEKIHTLHPQYAYPELFKQMIDWEPKIVHLAKENSEYQS